MRPVVNVEEKDRATDKGGTHKNLVKIAPVVPEISWRTDRQRETDRPTDIYSSQYLINLHTYLLGVVIIGLCIIVTRRSVAYLG